MNICLIGNINDALKGNYIGGAEKQCALLAIGLANKGHYVVVVDIEYTGAPYVNGGIKIIPAWGTKHGFCGMRFIPCRIYSLLRKLKRINADVYYMRGSCVIYAIITQYCRNLRKKVVWALSGDGNISRKYLLTRNRNQLFYDRVFRSFFNQISNLWTMRKADIIFCQTKKQLNLVRRSARKSIIVPNIFDGSFQIPHEKLSHKSCLWVGKLCGFKGEEELLRLSRILVNYEFRVVGDVSKVFLNSNVMRQLKNQRNVKLLGRLQYNQVLDEMQHAPILICTSPSEGFSNTFLEAWACKCTVVSLTVNPDNLLSEGGFGFCAYGNLNKMAMYIKMLSNDNVLREEIGEKVERYVKNTHSSEQVVSKIEKVLLESK